jgi:hypothetical protein
MVWQPAEGGEAMSAEQWSHGEGDGDGADADAAAGNGDGADAAVAPDAAVEADTVLEAATEPAVDPVSDTEGTLATAALADDAGDLVGGETGGGATT